MKKTTFFAFVALFLLANLSFGQLTNYSVGQAAPNFTVTDLHGDSHTLSSYAGKWVIVDLFAYWCGPCAQIAPIVNTFYKKYGCNGYDIVVLAVEYEGTTAQTEAFEAANGGDPLYPTPTVSGLDGGGGAVHATYGPAAYPTVVLIGPDGKFKNIDIWPIGSITAIETAVTNAGGGSALVPRACTASTDELTLVDAEIYPNPVVGEATLSLNSPNAQTIKVSVVSMNGAVLQTTDHTLEGGLNQLNINVNELASGSYFLNIVSENETLTTAKFVKQ